MKAKSFRWLQLITGIHYVHHIQYSCGWVHKLYPFIGYFPGYKKLFSQRKAKAWNQIWPEECHDSTWTGIY
ncbi:hypothetical protein SAMN04487996_107129 [Dyadobacter soli]|uniref:Uncharacterized protein n=1 Tax=Dyadobacter soli TaxID=659014 RepID=A0A1G7G582_9BACT|nr:hypothetical protein SAMN04487996_107129 [Dyadobacter soli]